MSTSLYRQSYTRKPNAATTGCVGAFFGLFLIAGLASFYIATVQPMLQAAAALRWPETPCVVDSSQVVVHHSTSSRGGPTYSIEVVYHYRCDGGTFTSRRYQFSSGSNSAHDRKQRIVDQYPPGKETVCYVNPSHPSEAVIDRGLNADMFLGCFALIFAAVGGGGLYFVIRGPMAQQRPSRRKTVPEAAAESGEIFTLKPETTPLGKFLLTLFFAVFWNGFMSIFFYLTFLRHDSSVSWFAKAFVGLFCFIGLLLIAGVFGTFFALFNPRVRVTSRTRAVALGGEFQFQWSIGRQAKRIRKLRISLEGCEQATERRGKSVQTYTELFAKIPVFETVDSEIPTEGQGRVVIPAGLMHTFQGRYNKIIWRLRIQGEIAGLPGIEDAYPIAVLPHRPSA